MENDTIQILELFGGIGSPRCALRNLNIPTKATIDEQESVTAWDVLQKCLTTYRCECIIHSLTKTIDIYDRIGSDKGCYFMEGLNLRKISLNSGMMGTNV